MKRTAVTLLLVMLTVYTATPCSTFFINHNGQLVFGRNYDWVAGTGMVCTNHRGLAKTSFVMADGRTISWTSKYGSITFNQYGKEFPTGGMNEKGLVVELMWLNETRYPEQDERPAISVLQWIQYQLDNCATIDELIDTDKRLRISATSAPLHYLVADAKGDAATIEFLNGKMVVHKAGALAFPVLTNSVYSESVKLAKDAIQKNNIPGSGSSEARFIRACSMLNDYTSGKTNKPVIDHAFDVLSSVKQSTHTKWSIVYDIRNKKIYFKTLDAPEIKTMLFSSFELACSQQPLAVDMNIAAKGDISKLFKPFNTDFNFKTIAESARLSSGEVEISKTSQQLMAAYADLSTCR
jgi:penicillin V acylase-like amidase (Ntn superfamily)